MYNKIEKICNEMKVQEDNGMGIYFIINTVTSEVYVGQSVNKNRRYGEHISASERYSGNPYSKLYHSMNKYGIDNFKYYKGIYVPQEDLNEVEIYFISKFDTYNNGLNMTEGGHLGGHNSLLTEDQVMKIKEKLKLDKQTSRSIAREFEVSHDIISNINRGETHRHIGYDKYQFPIRENPNPHVYNTCKECGESIGPKADRCKPCSKTGERGTGTKLTEGEVKQIIEKLIKSKDSIVDISKEFGISTAVISSVNNGHSWGYLTEGKKIPLRQTEITKCSDCGIIISKGTLKCRSCHRTGENHSLSKLTEDEVLKIIDIIINTEMTYGEIGDIFGVAAGNISKINNGTRWKHLLGQYKIPLRGFNRTNYCTECKTEIEIGNKLCTACEEYRKSKLKVRLLKNEDVIEIMYKLMEGNLNNREIGDKYNADSSTISRINSGNTRKEVTQPYAYRGYPLRAYSYTLAGRINMEIDYGLSGLDILTKYKNFYGQDSVCKTYESITHMKIL